jgi:hypothetical protein
MNTLGMKCFLIFRLFLILSFAGLWQCTGYKVAPPNQEEYYWGGYGGWGDDFDEGDDFDDGFEGGDEDEGDEDEGDEQEGDRD